VQRAEVLAGNGYTFGSFMRMRLFDRLLFNLLTRQRLAESRWTRLNLKVCGQNVQIDPRVFIWSPSKVEIGDGVTINGYTVVYGGGGVLIERNVMVAANCIICSVTHSTEPDNRTELLYSPISLQENCWLGAGTIVMPGVTIGRNSVAAAGSVVTADIPENCLCSGVPAVVKKYLGD
jgi:acetyltransferase-like isoleucine patch superfamily enzyme